MPVTRSRPELPLLDARPRAERADAARNRRRILEVAERLFAERGVERVTMDEVAAAARVGKGTLYRRFGDRAGLAGAVLDDRERALQDAILSGPPPLGPGAPPRERLIAFLGAYLDYLETDDELILTSETATPGGRYRLGAYRAFRLHVLRQLEAIRADLDQEVVADLVLAAVAGDLFRHLRRERGLSVARIRDGLVQLVDRACR